MTTPVECFLTNSLSDIDHVESQTISGLAITKVFFQPKVQIGTAISQLVAGTQSTSGTYPPGKTPLMILKYSATNVPILQLGLSGPTLSELPTLSEARPSLEFCLLTLPETRLARGFSLPTLSKVRAPCENRLPTH